MAEEVIHGWFTLVPLSLSVVLMNLELVYVTFPVALPFPTVTFYIVCLNLYSLLTLTDHLLVFQAGYSSPTQSAITAELGLSTAEV